MVFLIKLLRLFSETFCVKKSHYYDDSAKFFFKHLQKLCYLGSAITENGRSKKEIIKRFSQGMRAFHS